MDFDESIFEEFVLEASENLEAAEDCLSQLIQEPENLDPELLDQIFRSIHSIKGAAGFLMLNQMEKLAYPMESLLSLIRDSLLELNSDVSDILKEGIDTLKLMLKDVMNSDEIDIFDLHERINALINQEDSAKTSVPPETKDIDDDIDVRFEINPLTFKKLPAMHEFLYILEYDLSAFGKDNDKTPVELIKNLLSVGIIVDAHLITKSADIHDPLPHEPLWYIVLYSTILGTDFIDDAVELASDRIFSVDKDQLGDINAVVYNIKSKTISLISSEIDINEQTEYESSDEYKILEEAIKTEIDNNELKTHEIQSESLDSESEIIKQSDNYPDKVLDKAQTSTYDLYDKIDLWDSEGNEFQGYMDKLDVMINLVGELVIAESMVTNNPDLEGLSLDRFDRSAHNLRRIISELQNIVMSVRMIPLGGLFRRLSRFVRDLSMKSGKQIHLKIIGQETEVDKTLLDKISDSLVQILSNSVQHGIELPQQRKKAGKAETGVITLEARNESGELLIFIADNGQGINRADVLAKAAKRGIINDDGNRLSYEEVCQLIFKINDSEDENMPVDSMGMVKKSIEKLKGIVHVQSTSGEGTNILLKIPLTLTIIDGMLIRVGKASYTIPMLSIRESFRPDASQITKTMSGQELVRIRNNFIPIIRLHKLYDVDYEYEKLEQGILINVLSGSQNICLFADEIIGHHQTVIKSMPEYLNSIPGISGCTILDSGEIGLILDIPGIVNMVEV